MLGIATQHCVFIDAVIILHACPGFNHSMGSNPIIIPQHSTGFDNGTGPDFVTPAQVCIGSYNRCGMNIVGHFLARIGFYQLR
jgi:hypothetical protein